MPEIILIDAENSIKWRLWVRSNTNTNKNKPVGLLENFSHLFIFKLISTLISTEQREFQAMEKHFHRAGTEKCPRCPYFC